MTEEVVLVLVEDKPSDTELIMRVLKKHNLANNLAVLPDGAEALDFIFARGRYSDRTVDDDMIVLLDLKLPKVDGLDVLRQIKTDERTKKIPVVVVTASGEERDLQAAYDLGANSYVVKPIQFGEFSKVVASLGIYWLMINKRPA